MRALREILLPEPAASSQKEVSRIPTLCTFPSEEPHLQKSPFHYPAFLHSAFGIATSMRLKYTVTKTDRQNWRSD